MKLTEKETEDLIRHVALLNGKVARQERKIDYLIDAIKYLTNLFYDHNHNYTMVREQAVLNEKLSKLKCSAILIKKIEKP